MSVPLKDAEGSVFPALRLYRHALESIFGMLELQDLIQILLVSREWAAAVRSMAPINAAVDRDEWRSMNERTVYRPLPPIASIVGSTLLRHLAAIHISDAAATWTPLNSASLGLLAEHATNLQSLWCTLKLSPNEPLTLPAKLQSLKLQLAGEYTDDASNVVLRALAALPSLSRLSLKLAAFDGDLTLLAACPSLRDLTLIAPNGGVPKLADAQVDQIRSSLGQLHRFSVIWMYTDELARFLQPPVTARWQDIGGVVAGMRTGELLLRLSTLTKLVLHYEETAQAEWLQQLPHLTSLTLHCFKGGNAPQQWCIPPDAVLASLVRCSGIIDLSLNCGFTSAHWSALFDKLTIKKLTVDLGEIEALRCFAVGPITHSLEQLTIRELEMPPSALSHLYALRCLRSLRLEGCFSSRLDDDTVDMHSPPTPLLPALTDLYLEWREHSECDFRHRHGPSFEWMQTRRTQ